METELLVYMIVLLKRWVLKRLLFSDNGEILCSEHSLYRSPRRQCSLSQYGSFTWKMVLKRLFVGDTCKDSAMKVHCSGFLGDGAFHVDTIVLVKR